MKRLLYIAIAALFATSAWADEVTDFSTTAGSNTSADWGMAENIAPSDVNNNFREAVAIIARWYGDWRGNVVAYGAANALRITPNRTISTLHDGLMFHFEVNANNTGATTLAIPLGGTTLTAKTIKKDHDVDLASGDLEAGQKVLVVYDADADVFQLLSRTAISALTDPMTTKGDIVYRNSVNSTARLALGSTDFVLTTTDGQNLSWQNSPAVGKHTIWIPAGSMLSRTTTGAAAGTSELATNFIMTRTLDYDQATDEFAQFQIAMPTSWDLSTLQGRFYWTSDTATGTAKWGLQCVSHGDNDALDTAFGTAQEVEDTVTATDDLMVSGETADITCAGTPADGDLVIFQVYRDADDANDDKLDDAKLLGVKILYTTNKANDSD